MQRNFALYTIVVYILYNATATVLAVGLEADEIVKARLDRVAFGSCQNINRDRTRVYNAIINYKPDIFLYTGDIVYAPDGCHPNDCLAREYRRLSNCPLHQHFVARVPRVDGIYDDHDFGVNDAHDNYPFKEISRQLLFDFLKVKEDHVRRNHAGAYTSIEYQDPENDGNRIKIIILDVRYNRSCYYSCASPICNKSYMPDVHAFAKRNMQRITGLGCNHPGDTLGEEQWEWLEGQLTDSKAQAHVIVSSIQVFSRFPMTETWGLLPQAKRRLVELLIKTRPRNPIFVSGDVHYGEIMSAHGLIEITSSSMTHSLFSGSRTTQSYTLFYRIFCLYLQLYKKGIMGINNFGTIEFDYEPKTNGIHYRVSLRREDGGEHMHVQRTVVHDPYEAYKRRDEIGSYLNKVDIIECTSVAYKIGIFLLVFLGLTWILQGVVITLLSFKNLIFKALKFKHKHE